MKSRYFKKAKTIPPFPMMMRAGPGKINGNRIEYSFTDSEGKIITRIDPLLTSDQIIAMADKRYKLFVNSGPGTRESEEGRVQRKYISAHPEAILKDAWGNGNHDTRMELEMMLAKASHYGNSSKEWLDKNAVRKNDILGEDGKAL